MFHEINIVRHSDAKQLVHTCGDILSAREDINNNIIQLIDLLTQDNGVLLPPFWFAAIEYRGRTLGCCVHAEPDGMVISDIPLFAVRPLTEAILKDFIIPRRIVGPPKIADTFANQLVSTYGCSVQLSGQWRIYRLDGVCSSIENKAGELRRAEIQDLQLVADWAQQYNDERRVFLDVKNFMSEKLKNGELFFWVDQEPRTMISISGKTRNGVRISSVFTPLNYRSRGYASAAVHSISEMLLKQGNRFIVLTAEEGEPVTQIYEKIGFYPIGTRRCYVSR